MGTYATATRDTPQPPAQRPNTSDAYRSLCNLGQAETLVVCCASDYGIDTGGI